MLKRVSSTSYNDLFCQYTETTRTFEFMIKFKIEMEGDDSSSMYSASGTTPLGMIEEREKKKYLKVRINDVVICGL